MADDHLFPQFMVKVSQKRGVPAVSIVSMAVCTILLCQLSFTTLIMATTPLMLYLYIALAIAIRKLRKIYPLEERKKQGLFYIPGGKAVFNFMTFMPFVISIIALYVNGTEYFLSGFVLLGIGLIGYLLCKWIYGGLYKVDPEKYPLNPKTKLAVGDSFQVGLFVALCGACSLLGSILLRIYEGDWGGEYYLEEYETGLFSDFEGMLELLQTGGIATLIAGLLLLLLSRKLEIRP